MLLNQWPAPAKIAVLTFDSKNLGEELLGIDNPAERTRVVIGGIEGGELWRNELKRPPCGRMSNPLRAMSLPA